MRDKELFLQMGERIAQGRRKMKISQGELAEKIEVSSHMISSVERGVKSPRAENLLRISEVLQVSVDYLLTGKKTEREYSEILQQLRQLPPKGAEKIEQIVRECIELYKEGLKRAAVACAAQEDGYDRQGLPAIRSVYRTSL